MEWIKAIIASHTDESGVVNLEEVTKEINKQFPQHAVPKDQYNNISQQLKDANETVESLEKKTKDNPDLQKLLQDAKDAREQAETQLLDLQKQTAFENAVRDKVVDVDFARFKFGEVKLNKDGGVDGVDTWLESYATNHPTQVVVKDPESSAEPKSQPTFFGATPATKTGAGEPQPKSPGELAAERYKQKNPHLFEENK